MEHVERPLLPWRDPEGALTECGRAVADAAVVISRAAFLDKVRRQGQQRSMMTTCVTCWNTARRWPTWEESPVACVQRETHQASRHNYNAGDADFRAELLAIAALIAAHRDEFDGIIAGLAETGDLAARRAQRTHRQGRVRR